MMHKYDFFFHSPQITDKSGILTDDQQVHWKM